MHDLCPSLLLQPHSSDRSKKVTPTQLRDDANLTERMIALLIVLASSGLQQATSLQVFDCQHPEVTYKVIDLVQPATCPDPINDYAPEQESTIQILQVGTAVPVAGFLCHVTITKEVTRCGLDSITYGTTWPVWKQQWQIDPSACRKAVDTGRLKVDNDLYTLRPGEQHTFTHYSHGSFDTDGRCKVASFSTGGRSYSKSVERTIIDIELKHIHGTYNTAHGKVKFANGVMGNFKDGIVRDAYVGTILWNNTEPDCESSVSPIYHGKAKIHRRLGDGKRLTGSIVVVQNKTTNQFAGLVLKEAIATCGVHAYTTQLNGLVVYLLRSNDSPILNDYKPNFDIQRADLGSQISYLHVTTNLRMERKFEEILAELCDLDRKTLYNKLQAVADHNPYALLDLYGHGHQVHVAGAVAYVLSCVPVEASRVAHKNCTVEIPVMVNDTARFADPLTYVLREFANVIPCSSTMPVRWLIQQLWYCVTPSTITCGTPVRLNLTTVQLEQEDHDDFLLGLGAGAFTEDQKAENARYLFAADARGPIESQIAGAAADGRNDGHLGSPLQWAEVDKLKYEIKLEVIPFFSTIGNAWTIIMGLWISFLVVKATMGCGLRILILYKERGFGIWLLAALWASIFVILRVPLNMMKQTADAVSIPLHLAGLTGKTGQAKDKDDDTSSDSGVGEKLFGKKRNRAVQDDSDYYVLNERIRILEQELREAKGYTATTVSTCPTAEGEKAPSPFRHLFPRSKDDHE